MVSYGWLSNPDAFLPAAACRPSSKATAIAKRSKRSRRTLKTSFTLSASPFKNPRLADDWEPYLEQKRAEVASFTTQLADAEAELNDRVFRLFQLTPDEIRLLQREVEH